MLEFLKLLFLLSENDNAGCFQQRKHIILTIGYQSSKFKFIFWNQPSEWILKKVKPQPPLQTLPMQPTNDRGTRFCFIPGARAPVHSEIIGSWTPHAARDGGGSPSGRVAAAQECQCDVDKQVMRGAIFASSRQWSSKREEVLGIADEMFFFLVKIRAAAAELIGHKPVKFDQHSKVATFQRGLRGASARTQVRYARCLCLIFGTLFSVFVTVGFSLFS